MVFREGGHLLDRGHSSVIQTCQVMWALIRKEAFIRSFKVHAYILIFDPYIQYT